MSSTAHNGSNIVLDTYDIIFAGGGTVACIIAGRLSSADPSLKILILEAGSHTRDRPEHIQPARYYKNFGLPDAPFTFHVSKPSDALGGRPAVVPTARCVGGGSSVNFMMYTRTAASDYDDWETVYGNEGWGSKDLIPLLKKAETFQPGVKPGNTTHGDAGPIKVSYSKENINVGTQFLDVAQAYDTERGSTDDANDFSTCNNYGRWPKYVDETSGKRSDIPHHYIYNQDHKNLKIEDKCIVKCVLFEGNRAIGVEYIDKKVDHAEDAQEVRAAYATRLVIVSAGTFGSPAILERSGIGAANVLKVHDIKQIVDLPGVGENYKDHDAALLPYIAGDDADTLEVLFHGDETEIQPYADEWSKTGKGLLSHNAIDAGIKIRPNTDDLQDLGPAFEKRWQSYFANAPDKPIAFIGTWAARLSAPPPGAHQKHYSLLYFLLYPESYGRVHITSGQDVNAPLDFETLSLKELSDVRVLRWVYKKTRELGRRMAVYRGEPKEGHPSFPAGSTAATVELADGPVEISAPDIVYSAEDDEAIDEFHRKFISTVWHSMGTCAMKPRDSGGVVDSRLNVYGVQNLKVSDLSIAPDTIGGNTYNSAIAIGEKTASIISEELGIKNI